MQIKAIPLGTVGLLIIIVFVVVFLTKKLFFLIFILAIVIIYLPLAKKYGWIPFTR